MLLALTPFYKAPFLWALVIIQPLWLFSDSVRLMIREMWDRRGHLSIWHFLFLIIISVFIFRNMFFLVDVDSHSTYLYTQKLWLEQGTGLTGWAGVDVRTFLSQFDGVFYAFGVSLFGQEVLFPQQI